MGKIGKVQLKIKGVTEEFVVTFSRTKGFELIGFPEDVLKLAGSWKRDKFESEREMVAFYRDALDKYHVLIQKVKKVLVYKVAAPRDLVENADIPDASKKKLTSYGNYLHGDFGFAISMRVLARVEDNGIKYHSLDEHGKLKYTEGIADSEFIIDWTEEREQFFKTLEGQANSMVLNVLQFFAKDQEELLQIFDSGNVKLLSA